MIPQTKIVEKEEQKENKQNKSRMKNELTQYFNYITLLSKKRSPNNVRIIENYIKNESNIFQRICFIEDIDRKEKKTNKIEVKKNTTDKAKKKKYNNKDKQSNQIKLERISLIRYLLSTKKNIQNFGRRTNIIESRFIMSSKITDHAYKHYEQYLENVSNILITPISYIVHHGWKELELKTYNTIVIFYKFLKQMIKANNIIRFNEINNIYNYMEQFIKPYIQIVTNKKNINTINEALYETVFLKQEFKKQFRKILSTINQILDTDSRKISFFNIILAVFMIKYRFFYTLDKIIQHYDMPQIKNDLYDLDKQIILDIKKELNSSKKEYSDSERELFFLQFIEEGLYENNKINKTKYIYMIFIKIYCAELLMKFNSIENIKHSEGKENTNFISHLKEDIIYAIIRFIKGFTLAYSKFLNGAKVTIATKSGSIITKKLFAKWLFSKELEELENYKVALISFRENNAYLSIRWHKYEEYNKISHFDITKEEKLCGLIKKIISIIYSIGNKTSTICYKHYKASSLKDKDKIKIKDSQKSTITDTTDSPRFIPYSSYFIRNNPYLEKLTVIETLNEISSFSINLCDLMRHNPIIERKQAKEKHIRKVEYFFSIYSKIPNIKTASLRRNR